MKTQSYDMKEVIQSIQELPEEYIAELFQYIKYLQQKNKVETLSVNQSEQLIEEL